MENQNKSIEEICGLDKQCEKRWLEVPTDCI